MVGCYDDRGSVEVRGAYEVYAYVYGAVVLVRVFVYTARRALACVGGRLYNA